MKQVDQVVAIDIDRVRPFYGQPREDFAQDRLQELADSLFVHGQQTPCLVRPVDGGELFELIDGERRWRAMKLLEWKTVKCIVRQTGSSDEQFVQAVVANSAREDLSPAEAARAVARIAAMPAYQGLTQTDRDKKLAAVFGRSTTWISMMLKVDSLAPEAKTLLEAGKVTTGTAVELSALPVERQAVIGERIARHGMTGRNADAIVRDAKRVEHARSGNALKLVERKAGRTASAEVRLVTELISRIHETAELLLDMPAKELTAAYRSRPADRDLAIGRITAAIETLEQLQGSLDKLARS